MIKFSDVAGMQRQLTGDMKTEAPDAEKPLGRTAIRVEVAKIEHPLKSIKIHQICCFRLGRKKAKRIEKLQAQKACFLRCHHSRPESCFLANVESMLSPNWVQLIFHWWIQVHSQNLSAIYVFILFPYIVVDSIPSKGIIY